MHAYLPWRQPWSLPPQPQKRPSSDHKHKQDPLEMEVVQVGAFRNLSVLEMPATITAIPRDLFDAQVAVDLNDAMRNVAGVMQRNTSPASAQTFVARGVNLPVATK